MIVWPWQRYLLYCVTFLLYSVFLIYKALYSGVHYYRLLVADIWEME